MVCCKRCGFNQERGHVSWPLFKLNTQCTTLIDTLIFSAQTLKNFRRQSKIRATSPMCILFEFTTPYHDRYRPMCQFCSQRVQNGHFFTTHVENQTIQLILVFFEETFKYCSLLMYPTRIAFVRSSLAKLSETFSKVKYSQYKTWNKEVAIL